MRKPWYGGRHRALAAGLGFVLAAAIAGPVAAFGTINSGGQHAEHERITRWAFAGGGLGPATLDALAGARHSFGAVGAPDSPWRGLVFAKQAHCDGGDYLSTPGYPQSVEDAKGHLVACRAWMFEHLDQAVIDAGQVDATTTSALPEDCRFDGHRRGSAKCRVLEDLGLAFHAAQDFYAHTNWVDRPAASPIGWRNPPGLAQTSPAPWIDPARRAPFPAGLISGCWDGIPEIFFCGRLSAIPRVPHALLNKDEGLIDVAKRTVSAGETPRGAINGNFQRAVVAAVADTRAKWNYFQGQVLARYGVVRGEHILWLIKADRPSRSAIAMTGSEQQAQQ